MFRNIKNITSTNRIPVQEPKITYFDWDGSSSSACILQEHTDMHPIPPKPGWNSLTDPQSRNRQVNQHMRLSLLCTPQWIMDLNSSKQSISRTKQRTKVNHACFNVKPLDVALFKSCIWESSGAPGGFSREYYIKKLNVYIKKKNAGFWWKKKK